MSELNVSDLSISKVFTSERLSQKGKVEHTMYRKITIFVLLLSLLLAACGSAVAPTTGSTAATEVPPTEVPTVVTEPTTVVEEPTAEPTVEEPATEVEVTNSCPETGDDSQLIDSPAAGYCFLIPADFERSKHSDDAGFSLGIYGPASTTGHRERGFVNVTKATTLTVEAGMQAVIDEVLASLPGFTPTQSELTLGGVPAIQLDNLPGQDINRKIYALYAGFLYELTFLPIEESRPDAYAEMEQLYAMVVESFHFMPAHDMASSYAPLLSWEGEIDGACYALTIESNGVASLGVCGDEPSSTSVAWNENTEWIEVQAHFGNINAETDAGKVIFQGKGKAESDQWAHALATWAKFTAMELNAQRSSASVRTTLAWQLTTEPEHSGLCSQVIVLAYGFAYANQIPCEGSGDTTLVASGWLSATELDTFTEWVSNGARVESGLGYLDAQGETSISEAEIGYWASAVYTRLLQ